jgi:hypothetical protein
MHVFCLTCCKHSFVSPIFASCLGSDPSLLDVPLMVATPMGDILLAKPIYITDLVELNMIDFDVILGMDWLAFNHVKVDCCSKVIMFKIPEKPTFIYRGDQSLSSCNLITAITAQKFF